MRDVERHLRPGIVVLPRRHHPTLEASYAFLGDVDDAALLHGAAAVIAPHRDVQEHCGHKKGLAGFRLAEDDAKRWAGRDQAVDQPERFIVGHDVGQFGEHEAVAPA